MTPPGTPLPIPPQRNRRARQLSMTLDPTVFDRMRSGEVAQVREHLAALLLQASVGTKEVRRNDEP
jgi:hypothetical protein